MWLFSEKGEAMKGFSASLICSQRPPKGGCRRSATTWFAGTLSGFDASGAGPDAERRRGPGAASPALRRSCRMTVPDARRAQHRPRTAEGMKRSRPRGGTRGRHSQGGYTIVLVTHEPDIAAHAHRVCVAPRWTSRARRETRGVTIGSAAAGAGQPTRSACRAGPDTVGLHASWPACRLWGAIERNRAQP